MAQTTQVEIYVLVDSCGDTAQGDSREAAIEHYEDTVQALADCDGFRIVRVLVNIPLPEVSVVELTAGTPELEAATA